MTYLSDTFLSIGFRGSVEIVDMDNALPLYTKDMINLINDKDVSTIIENLFTSCGKKLWNVSVKDTVLEIGDNLVTVSYDKTIHFSELEYNQLKFKLIYVTEK